MTKPYSEMTDKEKVNYLESKMGNILAIERTTKEILKATRKMLGEKIKELK